MTCTGGAQHPQVPAGKGSCEMGARARGGGAIAATRCHPLMASAVYLIGSSPKMQV